LASFGALRIGRTQITLASTVQPFTAKVIDTLTYIPTGDTDESHSVFARRADGSTAEVRFLGPPENRIAPERRVILLDERKKVLVSDMIQSLSTTFLSDYEFKFLKGPPLDPTCSGPHDAGRATRVLGNAILSGVKVVGHIEEGKADRFELWEAPELNCYPVKSVQEWKDESGVVNSRTERTASVTLGEPSPSLFEVPGNYREKPPSVFETDLRAYQHRPELTPQQLVGMYKADQTYYKSREYAPK
jgi:hypothetical protein